MNYQHIGGRITSLNENNLLFSVGDFGDEIHRKMNNLFLGKLFQRKSQLHHYEILSIGSRNAQGLYYDESINIIIKIRTRSNRRRRSKCEFKSWN